VFPLRGIYSAGRHSFTPEKRKKGSWLNHILVRSTFLLNLFTIDHSPRSHFVFLEMTSPPEYNNIRRVSFPIDVNSSVPQALSSSPSSSSGIGIKPAPVSTTVNTTLPNIDGPRRRPARTVTVGTSNSDPDGPHPTRRQTSDSQRTGKRSTLDPNAGVLRRMTTGLLTPGKKIGQAPTYRSSIKAAVMSTWL